MPSHQARRPTTDKEWVTYLHAENKRLRSERNALRAEDVQHRTNFKILKAKLVKQTSEATLLRAERKDATRSTMDYVVQHDAVLEKARREGDMRVASTLKFLWTHLELPGAAPDTLESARDVVPALGRRLRHQKQRDGGVIECVRATSKNAVFMRAWNILRRDEKATTPAERGAIARLTDLINEATAVV